VEDRRTPEPTAAGATMTEFSGQPGSAGAPAGSGNLSRDPAFAGPLGEYARIAARLTEADPYAVLATTLVAVAAVIGPGPRVRAGTTVQSPVLFALLVAETPKANRGISWRLGSQLLEAAAPPGWGQVVPGLTGPAGLTGALTRRRRAAGGQGDDRPSFLVHEPAFAHVLAQARRSSSALPWLLRNAWEGDPPDSTRHLSARCHMGLVAHITLEQLRAQISLTDASASFLGRFLFVRVRRPPPVPDEGAIPAATTARLAGLLRPRLERARTAGVMSRGIDGMSFWFGKYGEVAADDPGGLLGIAVARAAWFVTRLSLVYAVASGDEQIQPRHLEAALSLWRYCRESAAWALGSGAVDSPEQRLLDVIRQAGPAGLSLTAQSAAFGRNLPAARIAAARAFLEERGLIETVPLAAPNRRGRPARISRLLAPPAVDSFSSSMASSGRFGGPDDLPGGKLSRLAGLTSAAHAGLVIHEPQDLHPPAAPARCRPRFEAVLFDNGGTLFQRTPAPAIIRELAAQRGVQISLADASARWSALKAGWPKTPEARLERNRSRQAHRAAYTCLYRPLDDICAGLAEQMYERYKTSPDTMVPYADVRSTLEHLREAGLAIGIVSNTGWDIRQGYQRAGLAHLIEVFVLSHEHGVAKPDPALIRRACDALGVAPASALMVGNDACADAGAAAAAGCPCLILPSAPLGRARGLGHVLALAGLAGLPGDPATRSA
jgi:HAD superfamily hydrolase (TIGR01549 family)